MIGSDWDQLPDPDEEQRRPTRISAKFDWHADALCASPEISEETFFGSQRQEQSMSPRMVRKAAGLCAECPAFADCLRSALEYEEKYGVWAGTSGRVRQRIQRMLARGEVTIDEVVDDYVSGNRTRYEGRTDAG